MRLVILSFFPLFASGCDSQMQRHVAEAQRDLKDPDPGKRADAASSLGNWGADGKVFLPLLHDALKDDAPLVRVNAAIAICEIDPSQRKAVVPIFAGAADGEDRVFGDKSIARNTAIIELRKCGSDAKSAVPVLKKRLAGSNPYERVIAAAALTQIDKSTYELAFPILAEGLKGEQLTRVEAARAYCALGTDAKQYLPDVRRLLDDKDTYVRSEVSKAWKKAGLN